MYKSLIPKYLIGHNTYNEELSLSINLLHYNTWLNIIKLFKEFHLKEINDQNKLLTYKMTYDKNLLKCWDVLPLKIEDYYKGFISIDALMPYIEESIINKKSSFRNDILMTLLREVHLKIVWDLRRL
jgi:hypothetical protein